ncbi:MAG: zinc ribbon domain-containing protein, partial [Pyrinomonadaceae bacterium]
MAVKPCPSCGSTTTQDARFCRVCGAPVKAFDSSEGRVSPQAQTIPLTDEARSTDGLSIEERRQPSAETSRISRVEVEKILQRRHTEEEAGDGAANAALPSVAAGRAEASVHDADYAAPTTGSLQAPPAVVASASPGSSTPAPARRKSRVWLASLVGFACIALVTALLAYYFIFSKGSRKAPESEVTTPAVHDEQQQQSQTASAETGVGPAVNPQPTQAPSPTLN